MQTEIKNYPQSTESYQVVHLDNNNKVMLKSNEFETLSDAKNYSVLNKSVLGFGEVEWRIVLIQKSLLDLSSSKKILK